MTLRKQRQKNTDANQLFDSMRLEKPETSNSDEQSAESNSNAEETEFGITFANENPIEFRLLDQLIELRLRATNFEIDDDSTERSLTFIFSLVPEPTAKGGLRLRISDWDVVPTRVENGGRQFASEKIVTRKFKRKLGPILGSLVLDEIQIPKSESFDGGNLKLERIEIKDGWATVQFETDALSSISKQK